jgi:hypothetical protein
MKLDHIYIINKNKLNKCIKYNNKIIEIKTEYACDEDNSNPKLT